MMIKFNTSFQRRALLASILGVFAGSGLLAQTDQQWITIAYVKTEPGKAAEYRKFVEANWTKLAQTGVDAGQLRGAVAMRLTQPYATGAPFDYALVSFMTKRPSVAPMNIAEWDARAKKVGYPGMQEYINASEALGKRVKTEWLNASMRLGNIQTGNYMGARRYQVDREHRETVMQFLRDYSLPIATERINNGQLQGFSVSVPAMVSPEEAGYAVSLSFVYKDADAAMDGPRPIGEETFKKVFPGRSYSAYLNQLNTINSFRKPVATRIYEIVATVGALPAVQPSMP